MLYLYGDKCNIMAQNKRLYWVGINLKEDTCIICTTKTLLAKFFKVNRITVIRWIDAKKCPEGRLIYQSTIESLHKPWAKNNSNPL
jgi:tRNA U34 2-thiouridine synthase MnmA/TrmU